MAIHVNIKYLLVENTASALNPKVKFVVPIFLGQPDHTFASLSGPYIPDMLICVGTAPVVPIAEVRITGASVKVIPK